MPWTFAHPATVLCLRRHQVAPLSFLGLVAGSMRPTRRECPHSHCRRRSGGCRWSLAHSHPSSGTRSRICEDVVWHAARLQRPVFGILDKDFRRANVLQQVSTLLGVTLIVVAYVRWLRVRARGSSVRAVGSEAWRSGLRAFLASASRVAAGRRGFFGAAAAGGAAPVPTLLVRLVLRSTAIFATLITLRAPYCRRGEAMAADARVEATSGSELRCHRLRSLYARCG
jgi:hypothetical protein